MNIRKFVAFIAVALLFPAGMLRAAEAVTLSWDITGVAATQNKVVLTDYPVTQADGSASGQWVLNSTEPTYVKTSTTWIFTANAKTLQMGSSATSAAGTTLSLSSAGNPIPADATISKVEVLVKSVSTESTWSVAVGGNKAGSIKAPSTSAMGDCTWLEVHNVNLTGNDVTISLDAVETSGRYAFLAGIKVTYSGGSAVSEKVAAPTYNPASGSYLASGSLVTIASATAGSTVMASVDNGNFTAVDASGLKIEGTPGSMVTVRAYATKAGMLDSDVTTATFIIAAQVLVPPYRESFDSADALNQFTIFDENHDGSTWKFYNTDGAVYIEHQVGNPAKDDWLFTPGLQLEGGKTYYLYFDVKAGNAAYPEKLGVAMTKDPTVLPMVTTVAEPIAVENTDYVTACSQLTPSTSGVYYIGFHAVSDAGMYRLYLDNISLSEGRLPDAPDAPEEISVKNDPDGATRATVTITAPTKAINGTELTEVSELVLCRDGEPVKVFSDVTPGQVLTGVDTPTDAGLHTYSAYAVLGMNKGAERSVDAWVGIAMPDGPTDAMLTEETQGVALISWTAPANNIYGDRINPSLVTYNITDGEGNSVATGVAGTEYRHQAVEAGMQALVSYTITAVTAAGENATDKAVTPQIPVGAPYAVPYAESFTRWRATKVAEITGPWRVMKLMLMGGYESQDADEGLLVFLPDQKGDVASYTSGKIAVPSDAENLYLAFWLHGAPGSADRVNLTIDNGNEQLTEELKPSWDGWREHLVSLAAFGGSTVRINFTATAGGSGVWTALDNIQVKEIQGCDLSITRLRVPLEMDLNASHTITVDVADNGYNSTKGATVTLYRDDEKVADTHLEPSKRGETVTAAFCVIPTEGVAATYTAEVTVDEDPDGFPADNKATASTTILHPAYFPVENLVAEVNTDGTVMLSWDAPSAGARDEEVTETFERYDEFGINAAGEWTFVDGDHRPTYGINNGIHSFPNMASAMAFIVFNGTIPTIDTIGSMTFDAHSGEQFMASFSVSDGETACDDWLISPMLNGRAQTVSFFARSMSIGCHEKFEVYASSTDARVSSFVKIGEAEESTAQWTQFSYDLPEGTRHFAIRCISMDQYAFFVDDVTYRPAPTELGSIVGYDVWRDGVKLTAEPVAEPVFVDVDLLAEGSHAYEVVAVMPRGLSDAAQVSVTSNGINAATAATGATVTALNGVIAVTADAAASMRIYGADGTLIAASEAVTQFSRACQPGVYIVTVGNRIFKVSL